MCYCIRSPTGACAPTPFHNVKLLNYYYICTLYYMCRFASYVQCIGSLEVIIGNSLFMQALNCTTDQINCWDTELDVFCVFNFQWFQ